MRMDTRHLPLQSPNLHLAHRLFRPQNARLRITHRTPNRHSQFRLSTSTVAIAANQLQVKTRHHQIQTASRRQFLIANAVGAVF